MTDLELASKTIRWMSNSYIEIRKAGGVPEGILSDIPSDLLEVLIRNDIHLSYKPD